MKYRFCLVFLTLPVAFGCSKQADTGTLKFTKIATKESGISFNNQIIEDDSLNFYHNEYVYIGSGVGIGDFNNDGLRRNHQV